MRSLATCVLWAASIAVVAALIGLSEGGPSQGRADHLPAPPQRTYVVVIDGLRPHEVNKDLMPNLTALRQEATWYQQARAVFPAETLPNHAAMMTGVTGKRSGIVGNYFLNEDSFSRVERVYQNDPKMFRVETLITRLERACGPALSTATVLSKLYLWELFGTGPASSGNAAPRDDDQDQVVADYHWQPRPIIPVSDHTPDVNTMQVGFLPWMRTAPTPQFGVVNLGDVDRAGHADESGAYGEGRDQFHQAAIRATDKLLGDFVAELRQMQVWDETALVVLSDHGMDWSLPDHIINSQDATGPGDAPATGGRVFIANNGAADMVYVKGHDPDVRDRVADALKGDEMTTTTVMEGERKEQLGVERILTDREGLDATNEHPRRLYGLDSTRAGDIIALAKPGWRFSVSYSDNPLPGNHGHGVTGHSTLLVTGGHPLLATVGDGPAQQSVPGAVAWDPDDKNAPPARPPLPPQGGPGTMSVTPTIAPLLGLPPLPGGYDGQPLTEAFDAGALQNPTGICEGLGYRETSEPEQPPAGGPTEEPDEGPVAPAEGNPAPVVGSASTSLVSSRGRVGYRKPFVLSGRLERSPDCEAPQWVEIRRRARGAKSFVEFVEVPVRRDGTWRTELSATSNATYAAMPDTLRCATALSAPRKVLVAARLDLLPRARCSVRGHVIPAHPRSRVFLERRQGRRWRRIRSARLSGSSRFRIHVPGCADGRYRVVWPGQEGNARAVRKFRL
jgi:hypothetical protein